MKISNLTSHSIQSNFYNKDNSLKKGDIIEGTIVEKKGNNVTIDLGNGNLIKGKIQVPLNCQEGQHAALIIKEVSDSKIILASILEDNKAMNQDDILAKNILNEYGLIRNERNIEIISALMKFKMPINESNIYKMTGMIDKLEDIMNISENEKLEPITSVNNPLDIEIDKFIKNNIENGSNADDSMTKYVLTELEKIISNGNVDSSTIKKIAFLIKNDINISLNNILFLSDIINNNDFIEGELTELINQLGEEGYDISKIKVQYHKLQQMKVLEFDSSDKNMLNDLTKGLFELIEEIQIVLNSKDYKSTDILNKIENLNAKIEFLNNLNENSTFYYIPFKLPRENLEKNLFVLNKKRRNSENEKVKIFISLDTSNLQKVDVILESNKDKLTVDFRVLSAEILKYMEERKSQLDEMLTDSGYDDVELRFILKDKKEFEPLDIFVDDVSLNYMLDIRA